MLEQLQKNVTRSSRIVQRFDGRLNDVQYVYHLADVVAGRIVRIAEKNIEIKFDTSKPEGDPGRCADFSKAQRVLGWSPRVTLDQGLRRFYTWMATQP